MKHFFLFIFASLLTLTTLAQFNGFTYQTVIANKNGAPYGNKSLNMKFSILKDAPNGIVVYNETQSFTTNNIGLVNHIVGTGTTLFGAFGPTLFNNAQLYLKVEVDLEKNGNYVFLNTIQIVAVPFAYYALQAKPSGAAGGDLTGNFPDPIIKNKAVTKDKIADGVIPDSLPPIGIAGGHLAGTYPFPIIKDSVITKQKMAAGVIPDSLPPIGIAGGDLTGTYPHPLIKDSIITKQKIASGVLPDSLPPNGIAGGDLTGHFPNPLIRDSIITKQKIAGGVIPDSLPPIGMAGGDLIGTYPNPVIGDSVITKQKIATGVLPDSLPPVGNAGGDLAGIYPKPMVMGLRGKAISNLPPADGQILKWSEAIKEWVPSNDNSIGLDTITNTAGFFSRNGNTIYPTATENIGLGVTNAEAKIHTYIGAGGWTGITEPNNYNIPYAGTPVGGVGERFYWGGFQRFDGVNPDGRPNVVGIPWAYNATLNGGRENKNEAAFQFRTETHYEIGAGSQFFEFHLPEVITTKNEAFRLNSFYTNKNTGATFLQHRGIYAEEFYPYDNQEYQYAVIGGTFASGGGISLYNFNGANPGASTSFGFNDINHGQMKMVWQGGQFIMEAGSAGSKKIRIEANLFELNPNQGMNAKNNIYGHTGFIGNVRIGKNGALFANEANLHIEGWGNDNTTKALIIQKSNLQNNFVITDGGNVFAAMNGGNLVVGANNADGIINGNKTLQLYDGTAPSQSVTDGVILYAQTAIGTSELKVRDESGNTTTLSPHNFSGIPEGKSENLAWAYYSEKDGMYINVDMLKLARLVEQLTGEQLVFIGKINDLKTDNQKQKN